MTASLPVPNDIDPEEPDRHSSADIVALPGAAKPSPGRNAKPARKGGAGGKKNGSSHAGRNGSAKATSTGGNGNSKSKPGAEPAPRRSDRLPRVEQVREVDNAAS